MDSYQTIKSDGQSVLMRDRSEFLALTKRVDNPDDASRWIRLIKSEYKNATHHCSAYITGINGEHQFYDDDGEPHGSAGRPILGAMVSLEVTNLAVVVIRYYGGKKLGVRGLIDTYGEVAKMAIESSGIMMVTVSRDIEIVLLYKNVDRIHHLVKKHQAIILSESFLLEVTMNIRISRNELDHFLELIQPFVLDVRID